MKNLFKKYREVIMYVIFGALTSIVSIVSFAIFNRILGENLYLFSNALSWIVAVLFAYVVNKLWVFESKSWKPALVVKEAASFFAARIISFLIASGAMWLFVNLLHAAETNSDSIRTLTDIISVENIAKICSTVFEVVINYIFSKLWVFRKK